MPDAAARTVKADLMIIRDAAAALAAALLLCGPLHAAPAAVAARPADKAQLREAGIAVPGKLVRALHITDGAGEHFLVLSSQTGPSHRQPEEADARTDLVAGYYSRGPSRWVREWAIMDGVDCPVLDHHALFFPGHVTVTDLDQNGMAEVTVAYKLFCGGGIDDDDLKVILRQGAQKFAMRGRTRSVMPGGETSGGEAAYDRLLSQPAYAAFKRHIASVRAQVVTVNF